MEVPPRRRYRKLRIAWSVAFGAGLLLTVISCVDSYLGSDLFQVQANRYNIVFDQGDVLIGDPLDNSKVYQTYRSIDVDIPGSDEMGKKQIPLGNPISI